MARTGMIVRASLRTLRLTRIAGGADDEQRRGGTADGAARMAHAADAGGGLGQDLLLLEARASRALTAGAGVVARRHRRRGAAGDRASRGPPHARLGADLGRLLCHG